jgi:hypothetical protein
MGSFTDITAFCTTLVTSATLSGVAAAGGSDEFEDEPLPPQDRHIRTAAQSNRESPESPKR